MPPTCQPPITASKALLHRQQLAGSDGQFVKCRANDSILDIECGTAVFAGDALAVLRIQVVVPLVTDSAGIVEGFAQVYEAITLRPLLKRRVAFTLNAL